MDRIIIATTIVAKKIKKIKNSLLQIERRDREKGKTRNDDCEWIHRKFFFGAFSNKINTSSIRIYTLKNTLCTSIDSQSKRLWASMRNAAFASIVHSLTMLCNPSGAHAEHGTHLAIDMTQLTPEHRATGNSTFSVRQNPCAIGFLAFLSLSKCSRNVFFGFCF